MASPGPTADAATGEGGASWTLPNWEEYSEAPSSHFDGDWSDVEVDVSLDTASSVASTEHQRVYKLQRARGGFPDEKQRNLRDIPSLYTKRRLEDNSVGALSVRSSRSVGTKWFQPAPCASPRPAEEKPLSPIDTTEEKKEAESGLLVQQSEISSELQAVRRQLSDFQDKWKKTVEERQQSTSCDHAVLQVQTYHDERLQQVVDESLAELKLVRGRYKKKEAKLEEELRAAKNAAEQWKQTAAEAEHRKKLDRQVLEFQLVTIKKQYEHACQRYEDDATRFRETIRQLREEKDNTKILHDDFREKIASQERRHEDGIKAMQSEHELKVAELTAQLEQAKNVKMPSVCAVATQTEVPSACTVGTQSEPTVMEVSATTGEIADVNDSQTKIEELTRRCRALEKLLDKKFEDTPSLASSQRRESCHSDQGLGLTSSLIGDQHELSASRSSSVRIDTSIHRANGKSKALARVLLGSSRASLDRRAAFTDETTLATDEATLGAHEMWDSASFTSIDSIDDLASQRTTPRAASMQRMKSTQEILTLVRQLKHAAGSPIDLKTKRREPEPEINWDALSKQKYVRYPPSSSAESRGGATALHRVDNGAPVKTGVSVFDDLLTDAAAPSPAIESVQVHELPR
ncbi:hypothetical protein PHYBOEH_010536 [Phytophthora boehmeriae]|uniref:Uncharacterized protein n=1 Tax=Phytophthora boehmeriae TaxID=109152 RepID=A0A8T1VN02_9STRA|nr:hypothetical protein PHYBOEH_010536 [Phytophthora boehmeriae]